MLHKLVTGESGARRFLASLVWAGVVLAASGKELGLRTEASVMVEFTLRANRSYADAFNEVTLDVTFVDPRGRELRVPGFWEGADVWKVRYASPVEVENSVELGRRVAELVNGEVSIGMHEVIFGASNLSSGMYACVLQTPTIQSVRLMQVLK